MCEQETLQTGEGTPNAESAIVGHLATMRGEQHIEISANGKVAQGIINSHAMSFAILRREWLGYVPCARYVQSRGNSDKPKRHAYHIEGKQEN